MKTIEECREGVKLGIETRYPLFVAKLEEIINQLAAGAFSVEFDLNLHTRLTHVEGIEKISINEAVWYIQALGFYAESDISKKIEVSVEPLYEPVTIVSPTEPDTETPVEPEEPKSDPEP